MKLLVALKRIFIPHEENDYKPHLFRQLSLTVIVTGSFFLLGVSAGSSFFIHKTVLGASVVSSVLVDLTNESRIANNEEPLTRSDALERAAQLKADDMVREGYFAHDSPKGITPWHWFKVAGYNFLYAGENLAVNFFDSADVEKAWLDSPAHRANILNAHFKEIGIATAEGMYQGKKTIFVVQMFGSPAVATTPKKTTVSGTVSKITKQTVSGTSTKKAEAPIPVLTTKELAVVANPEENIMPAEVAGAEQYATWYDRIVFSGSSYVDSTYKIIILFIGFALIVMLVMEVKKRHWKHITYGIVTLLIVVMFLNVNREFFMTHFIS